MSIQLLAHSSIDDAFHAIASDKVDPNSVKKLISKIALLTIGVGISATAKYFAYPISKEAGISIFGENSLGEGFGYTFQVFYSKAFFILEMWAISGLVHSIIGGQTKEEDKIRGKMNLCAKAVVTIAVIAASAFARYPFALPAASYNPSMPLLAGGFTLAASLFIPMRSIQMTLEKILEYSRCTSTPAIREAKSSFIGYIASCQSKILEQPIDQQALRQETIERLPSIATRGSEYFAESIRGVAPSPVCPGNLKKSISFAGALLLGGILEYAIGDYTFHLTKKLVLENDALAGSLAVLAVATTFYIYGRAIYSSHLRALKFFSNCCSKETTGTLSERIYPIAVKVLRIEEFITNLIALGPWYQIWGAFYDQPASKHWFFVPILLLTLFETIQTSSHDKLDDCLLSSLFLRCTASSDEIKAVKLHKNFERFKSAIQDSSDKDFIAFYSTIPTLLKDQIFQRSQIENLNQIVPLQDI